MRSILRVRLLALLATLLASASPIRVQLHAQPAAPDTSRAGLAVPQALWEQALAGLRCGSVLGYTADQMLFYNPDQYILRTVWGAFRDVRSIPRYSGQVSQGLLDNALAPDAVVQRGFALTDISSARNLPMPTDSMENLRWWGPANIGLPGALDSLLNHGAKGSARAVPSKSERQSWERLPKRVRLLIARVVVGMVEAGEWIDVAMPRDLLREALADTSGRDAFYRLAARPWIDDRLGQLASVDPWTFQLLGRVDRRRLAFGSVLLSTHVNRALAEFNRDDSIAGGGALAPTSFGSLRLATALGMVEIRGAGDDTVAEGSAFVLDLGGDDYYRGRHATSWPFRMPVALLLDLAGDDRYIDTANAGTLACGLFGVGAIVDVRGNDYYRCRESGLGCAWYGVGLLLDSRGNDQYVTDSTWGQGAAHIGVGALVDLAGDDRYTCGSQSQAMGATLGAGLLVDVAGNDRYIARDDGNISALYLGQSVSMSQGVGYGRRADLGDGHSLSGGVGVLVDGAGNDYYSAPVWSQGAGYWWGLGILEDRSGDDVYRSGKYSMGAGAHFAIGCRVDLAGDDRYAVGYDSAVNQYIGHARDGSIGISIDGGGDDQYFLKSHCAGSADLGSIGLFWDRRGNDRYTMYYQQLGEANGWTDTPPLGSATMYTPFNSFRDDLGTYGLFLDTGGDDTYRWDERGSTLYGWDSTPGNGVRWSAHRSVRSHGFGVDGAE